MSCETFWDALGLIFGGEGGIRTRGRLLTYTRFPGVRLKPLIHLSAVLLLILGLGRQRLAGRVVGLPKGAKDS